MKGTTDWTGQKVTLAAIEPISAVFFTFAIMNEHFFAIDFMNGYDPLFAVLLISLRILDSKSLVKLKPIIFS